MGQSRIPFMSLVHWWVNSYSAKTQYMHIRSPQPPQVLKCQHRTAVNSTNASHPTYRI